MGRAVGQRLPAHLCEASTSLARATGSTVSSWLCSPWKINGGRALADLVVLDHHVPGGILQPTRVFGEDGRVLDDDRAIG